MPGFKLGQEDARQLSDAGGVPEVILHEMFDGPASAGIDIAHPLGHQNLQIEGQLIGGPFGDVVHVTADSPQECLGPRKGLKLLLREQAGGHKAFG